MKKIIIGIGILGMTFNAYSQKSEVNEAKKAWGVFQATHEAKSLAQNLELLTTGLAHTDKAIAHEKTKGTVEPWALRASLASAITYLDTLDDQNSLNKQKIAEEAIEKVKNLDTKKQHEADMANAQINVANAMRSRAVKAYNEQNFARAYQLFKEITDKNPTDTAMYLNAGVAARQAGKYDEAINSFKKMISFNVPNAKELYLETIGMELDKRKDTTASLALIDEALAKFPEDPDLIGVQTDIYTAKGEIEKTQELLAKLIAKDPNKAIYQFLMGETYYKQALAVQAERLKLDDRNITQYNAMGKTMNELVDKALPFYLKAKELDPKAPHTLEALKQVYAFKNDSQKYEEIKKEIEALQKP